VYKNRPDHPGKQMSFSFKRAPASGGLPEPFLKWAGGKRQLLPELMRRIERIETFGRYHEPFVGGGALFFELFRRRAIKAQARLSDNNPNLIVAYEGVKNETDAVIRLLEDHRARHCKEYYYEMRAAHPTSLAAKAARIIYLNRTCFNGLFRENSKGEFNVPFGSYKNPRICHEENLRAVAKALKKAKVEVRSFETVLGRAEPGDLVYFDPPYDPVSETSSFTAYHQGGFGRESQEQLAEVFRALDDKGVKLILSNSATQLVLHLYKGFRVEEVQATRRVSCRGDGRGAVNEALVSNLESPGL